MPTNNWRMFRAYTLSSVIRRSAAVAVALLFAIDGRSEIAAQTVRNWTGATNSNWTTTSNWSPAGTPSPLDQLYLSTGDTATTTTVISVNTGGLIDMDNAATLTLNNLALLTVGPAGGGAINLRDGARIIASGSVDIGNGGDGIIRLFGSGTTLGVTDNVTVGDLGGSGTLDIANNAVVDFSGNAEIAGGFSTSVGLIRVDTGGEFNSLSPVRLYVGGNGAGALEILGGGSATNGGATIGSNAPGQGRVLVDGAGSLWDVDGGGNNLVIGGFGQGTLDVANGGRVESNEAILGDSGGSSGRASVRGTNSSWDVGGTLTIGDADFGMLEIFDGGTVESSGATIASGGSASNSSATLRGAGSFWDINGDLVVGNLSPGEMLIEGGATVNSSGNNTRIANNSTATNSSVTVIGGGSFWFHSGSIVVGNSTIGKADVLAGGRIESAAVQVAGGNGSSGTVNIDGPGSRWDSTSSFIVGNSGSGTLNITNGARVNSQLGIMGGQLNSIGSVTVDGAGSKWTTTNQLTISSVGEAFMTISDRAEVEVGTTTTIGNQGTLRIDGGSLTTQSFSRVSSGVFDFQSGTLTVDGGVFNSGPGTFTLNGTTGDAAVHLTGSGVSAIAGITVGGAGELTISGDHLLTVGSNMLILNTGAVVNLAGGTLALQTGGSTTAGEFNFTSGTLQVDSGTLTVSELAVPSAGQLHLGGAISGPVLSQPGSIVAITGNGASLGSASSFLGVDLHGTLYVDNSVTLQSAGPARLGALTAIDGTMLTAPNGVALGEGDVLSLVSATVSARVFSATGSLIDVSEDSTVGDASAFDGFVSNGNVVVDNGETLTIHDRNQAVLNGVTTLADNATLTASEGIIVNFGGVLQGDGTVDTPDDPGKPTIVNGHMEGESAANILVLAGYVKGIHTFNNVKFAGTHAPGLSPAAVSGGNVAYGDTATLEIELGGTTPGSQHDQVNSTGDIAIDGTLDVVLINGFVPSLGDTFDILTAVGGIAGTFDTVPEELPAIGGGLLFDILYDTNVVTLAVIGVAGDYNLNGVVDAADYTVWRDTLGQSGDGLAADGDADNTIDQDDYDLWVANFGMTAGSGAGAAASNLAAVPEPVSVWLLLAGGLFIVCRPAGRLPRRSR